MCTGRYSGVLVCTDKLHLGWQHDIFSIIFQANANHVQACDSNKQRKGWFFILCTKINYERNYTTIFYVAKGELPGILEGVVLKISWGRHQDPQSPFCYSPISLLESLQNSILLQLPYGCGNVLQIQLICATLARMKLQHEL